jgi:hypothetical protein
MKKRLADWARVCGHYIVFKDTEDRKLHYKRYLRILTIAALQGHIYVLDR